VLRANLAILDRPAGKGRWMLTGSLEEIKEDTGAARALGARELIFDATFSPGVRSEADFLRVLDQIRGLV